VTLAGLINEYTVLSLFTLSKELSETELLDLSISYMLTNITKLTKLDPIVPSISTAIIDRILIAMR
jgi:hypothetical protein